ncbi:KTSC domain-containing protein [Paraburkholderia kururiensis]|uniref:KTSC domain-containing protein n=1 Tax=Paraburkholderia kururiensis TaxID=984307 RepID=UPI0005A670DF|nr:KTSC domain-containing protein [Paraburkholderia kururiensis]
MSTTASGIAMQEVESSQIHSIGHDPARNVLAIRFRSKRGQGSLYEYRNVTEATFEAFRTAESIGRYFGQHIKPNKELYPFDKVEEPVAA